MYNTSILMPEGIFGLFLLLLFGLAIAFMVAKARSARFREAGSAPDERTIQEYGEPAVSLFTSTGFLSLTHHIDITDAQGSVKYESNSKFLSIHDKTDVTRADGSHVAHIERKFFTLHQRRYITMADGTAFEVSSELWHIVKDIINIEGLGWKLEGNILAMNFTLSDSEGKIIAAIGQKFFSVHDKYSIDIYQPQYEETVVAILVCLQHMIRDREAASSSSSSSSSSSN